MAQLYRKNSIKDQLNHLNYHCFLYIQVVLHINGSLLHQNTEGNYIDCIDDLSCHEYYDDHNNIIDLGYCSPKIIQAAWDEGYVKLLFDKRYYEIEYDNVVFSFEIPNISHSKTNFTTFVKTNDNVVYLALNHSGLMKVNIATGNYRIFIPDTPSRNAYHALTVTSL